MNTITLREGTLKDTDSIVYFQKQMAMETEAKTLEDDLIRPGVEAIFKSSDKGFYLVAEIEDSVVGSLLVTYEWSDWRNSWFWWIQSVYVKKRGRRKGVYSHLYEEVKKLSFSAGNVCGIRLYVEKENKIAQSVYKNLGMYNTKYLLYETELSEGIT